jgi:hypothetical protein
MSARLDLIARYDAALAAVGDRYDGLEDAVTALAALVKQHPALRLKTHPSGSTVTLGHHVAQLVEYIDEFATVQASLTMMFEDEGRS